MHPRISVNALSSWHWTLQQDIAHWAAAGITRVGVPLATVDADPDGVRRLQEAPVVVDNVVVSKVFTLGDDSCWPSEQDHLRAQLDVAAALGARVCYVTTGPSRSRMTANESIDAFCRAVTPMVDEARRRGVVLAVEQNHAMTHEAGCIHSFRDLRMVADRTGIGMVVEVQNCWQDYGISDALREAAADVALVQVSDFVVGTETRLTRACPGDGDIPLAPILGALVDGGYPATFDIEVLGPLVEAMGYPVAIERSLRWLTAFLETTSSADETVGSRAVQMYGARVQGVCCMTNVTTERRADVADEAGMGFAGDMLFAPDEHEFRAEFRRWLDDNPPPRAPHAIHQTYVDEYLAWYRVLSAAGYGALHWPVEHGGGG
ncbi:MAG: TIM barrel protein, partial [Ilumatobacteraceae bacterium]